MVCLILHSVLYLDWIAAGAGLISPRVRWLTRWLVSKTQMINLRKHVFMVSQFRVPFVMSFLLTFSCTHGVPPFVAGQPQVLQLQLQPPLSVAEGRNWTLPTNESSKGFFVGQAEALLGFWKHGPKEINGYRSHWHSFGLAQIKSRPIMTWRCMKQLFGNQEVLKLVLCQLVRIILDSVIRPRGRSVINYLYTVDIQTVWVPRNLLWESIRHLALVKCLFCHDSKR